MARSNTYSFIILAAAALAAASAEAKPNPDVIKLIQAAKSADTQKVPGTKPDATPDDLCRARMSFYPNGNKYRTAFTQDGVQYEVIYTDLGGKGGGGNCVIDSSDSLVFNVKYGSDSSGEGSKTSKDFTDAGIDGRFEKTDDQVSFVGYTESITPADKKLIEDILNKRETTYQMGFDYDGQQLGVGSPNSPKLVMKQYESYIKGALRHYRMPQGKKKQRRR